MPGFTILSHAGLRVDAGGRSLVCDPWIVGSCYWRSWWNYPPPPEKLIERLSPDFIYLTHLHWDHFHSPSLKRFDPATSILVPRAHFSRMVEDLRSLGFRSVRELTHGVTVLLADGLKVTSYQFGPALDSALVVQSGEWTLLNANDCKLMGPPLRHLLRRHPKIDFVLRSHSSASAYPFCVSSEHPEDLALRGREDYAPEFLAFAEAVGARYAVPFASNHCFLHRETARFNPTIVSPEDIKRHFDAHGKGETLCRVMLPGDSWSSEGGFTIAPNDYFSRREARLAELAERHSETLRRFYAKEDAVRPDWETFEKYFRQMLASLPPGLGSVFPARVLFRVHGAEPAEWLLDFRNRRILRSVSPSEEWDFRVEVHANVLRDCCRKRMFSVFTASKRVHYHLRTKPALRQLFLFNLLMDLYESDCFPLRLMLRRRFLANWARRWREVFFYLSLLPRLALRRDQLEPIDYF